jgi:segregation and condensation protein B
MTESISPEQETVPAAPIDDEALPGAVEAILMSVDRAISAAKIAEAAGVDGLKRINEAIAGLNRFYEEHDRSFRIEAVAGGFQILTLPKHRDLIASLHKSREDNKLTPGQLETLAIIAYKQPIMRAQIETIRGVAAGEVIRTLMDRHLVKIVGRAEELGRPMLYGTTKSFLEVFGLASLKDLPKREDLHKP